MIQRTVWNGGRIELANKLAWAPTHAGSYGGEWPADTDVSGYGRRGRLRFQVP
jgi:hypothetical protein